MQHSAHDETCNIAEIVKCRRRAVYVDVHVDVDVDVGCWMLDVDVDVGM